MKGPDFDYQSAVVPVTNSFRFMRSSIYISSFSNRLYQKNALFSKQGTYYNGEGNSLPLACDV